MGLNVFQRRYKSVLEPIKIVRAKKYNNGIQVLLGKSFEEKLRMNK